MILLGLSILLGKKQRGPFLYKGSARGYYCFFLGCLLCDFYHKKENDIAFCKRIGWITMVCMIVILLASFQYGRVNVLGDSQIVWGLFFCPSLIWCGLSIDFVEKTLMLRPLQYLGKLSSHIYFWHFNCYFIIRIISEIIPIRQYYSKWWFYCATIWFIMAISILSRFMYTIACKLWQDKAIR